jgi:hypothetical protein
MKSNIRTAVKRLVMSTTTNSGGTLYEDPGRGPREAGTPWAVTELGLWHEGRIKLTELIAKKYTPDEINDGYADLMDGKNIRGVVVRQHEKNNATGEKTEGRNTMPNAILDPTGSVKTSAAKQAAPRAPRRASLTGARVGLLINTKTNARPFLEEVGRLLTERYGVTVTRRTKTNFAVPEPESVIKELVASSDVVVTGVGDCGSCSAAAAADGVVLEAAGIPVAAIITESFKPTADAMAALRGAPGYRYATTAHPVAVLTEDKVKERAARVLDDVVALLTEQTGA